MSKIYVSENEIIGKIKPMHAGGQPPVTSNASDVFFHYLTEAGIPYSRLHDVGGAFGAGKFVDIPNIFRDFNADVDDPASYDFTFTDLLLSQLMKAGVEPYYRLGVTIENAGFIKNYLNLFSLLEYEKEWLLGLLHVPCFNFKALEGYKEVEAIVAITRSIQHFKNAQDLSSILTKDE